MGTLRMLQRRNTMTFLHGECQSEELLWKLGAGTEMQSMQPRAEGRDLTNDVTHRAQGDGWLNRVGHSKAVGKATDANGNVCC